MAVPSENQPINALIGSAYQKRGLRIVKSHPNWEAQEATVERPYTIGQLASIVESLIEVVDASEDLEAQSVAWHVISSNAFWRTVWI